MVETAGTWSTSQKVMSVLLMGAMPLVYFWWRGKAPVHVPERKTIHKDFEKTIEEENPIQGKSRVLINRFLKRLSEDPMLSKYFHPRMLRPHSLYAVILERYMLVKMGEPYVQIPIDLRQKHKNLSLGKEQFERFKQLWRDCEKEMGLESSKAIWDDFEEEIIGTK